MPVIPGSSTASGESRGSVAARNSLSRSHLPKAILASRPVSLYRVTKAIRPARKDGQGKPGPMHVDGGTDGAARLLFEASCGATFSRNQPRNPAKLQRKRSQPHTGALTAAPKRAGVWLSYQSDKTKKSKNGGETRTGSVTSSQPEHVPTAAEDALSSITPWETQTHVRGPPQPQPQPERSMSRDSGVKAARKPSLPTHPEEPASNEAKSAGCRTCQQRLTEEPAGYDSDTALQRMRPSKLPMDSAGYESDSAARHPAVPTHSEVTGYDSDATIRQSTFRKPSLTQGSGKQVASSHSTGQFQFPTILHRTEQVPAEYHGSGSHLSDMLAIEASRGVPGASAPRRDQLQTPQARLGDASSKGVHDRQSTTAKSPHGKSGPQSPDLSFHQSWIGGGSPNSIHVRPGADLPHNLLQPGSPTSSTGIHVLPPVIRPQSAPPQNAARSARPKGSPTPVYSGPILQFKNPVPKLEESGDVDDMQTRLRKEHPVEIILTTPPPPSTPAWFPSSSALESGPVFPVPPTSTEASTPMKTNLRPRPLRASTHHLDSSDPGRPVDIGTQTFLPDLRTAESIQRMRLDAELAALPAATYPWLSLSLVRQVRQTFKTEFAVFQKQVDERLDHVEKQLEAQQLWFERAVEADNETDSDRTVKGRDGQRQS